jgi:hypothetical protein
MRLLLRRLAVGWLPVLLLLLLLQVVPPGQESNAVLALMMRCKTHALATLLQHL